MTCPTFSPRDWQDLKHPLQWQRVFWLHLWRKQSWMWVKFSTCSPCFLPFCRMKNPHLRAKLAEVLEAVMPHLDQTPNPLVSSVFHRKRVFCNFPHAPHLAEALIKVFVDIEFTGNCSQELRSSCQCMIIFHIRKLSSATTYWVSTLRQAWCWVLFFCLFLLHCLVNLSPSGKFCCTVFVVHLRMWTLEKTNNLSVSCGHMVEWCRFCLPAKRKHVLLPILLYHWLNHA